MRRAALAPALAVLALAVALPSAAQRRTREAPPSGAEIAQKAKAARLDRENAVTSEFQGKKIVFTPAELGPRHDLALGQVIGVLENDVAGDETGLPPGRYNIVAAKLADGWHVYAEAGGQIVKEAIGVRVEKHDGKTPDRRPRFRAKGWGYDIDFGDDIDEPPAVASVTITPRSDSLLIGEAQQFSAVLRDARGYVLRGRSVTWASSGSGIASVSAAGEVRGVGPGTATITATSEGKSGSATVTVPRPIFSVNVTGSTPLYLGQSRVFGAILAVWAYPPSPLPDPNLIEWKSSNPAVATVTPLRNGSGGATVTPVAEGPVQISATYRAPYGSYAHTRYMTVTRAPVTSITIAPAVDSVAVGEISQLTATVRDATGAVVTDSVVTWTSGDTVVAQVTTNGRVIARAPGPSPVTATAGGASGTATLVVTPPPVATVTVTPSNATVSAGQTTQLAATLRDAAGNELTGRRVAWSTNDSNIADVVATSGLVLGIYGGYATITATSEGKSGTAQVYVPAKSSPDPAPTTTSTLSFNW